MVEKKDGTMTVGEAGRKGGEKVASQRGSEFYSEIGRKGGVVGGHKGGEKVSQDRQHMSEIGHKGGEKVRELIEKGKGKE